ncbi:hypothetical protein KP509_31G028600 [Ceratopteris richardii]|nr:hypothetical protein KP509_31G028600 [Ceratopteris richardii]
MTGLSKQQRKKLKLDQQRKEEDRNRSEGLGLAISASNKGFKMLQQMGYKPGSALGKHGQGTVEPINLDVKRSRTGLGRDQIEKTEEQLKAKIQQFKREAEKRTQAMLKTEFQERSKTSWKGRKIVRDYEKAQNALRYLEEAVSSSGTRDHAIDNAKTNPELKKKKTDGKEEGSHDVEDESEEEIELQDLLDLLQRLRTEYFYCLYCGCQYESHDALLNNCPGLEEEDH